MIFMFILNPYFHSKPHEKQKLLRSAINLLTETRKYFYIHSYIPHNITLHNISYWYCLKINIFHTAVTVLWTFTLLKEYNM